jgi:site-specific recombinase XerD
LPSPLALQPRCGRHSEGAKVTLNEYLDRWLETAVKPRVRGKTCLDYEGILRRYVRPNLGERVLAAMRPLDLQTTYQQMIERDLRHASATLALAAGVPPKVVSEQLGHASVAFTLDTYAHVLPHMQDQAAAKMEMALLGAAVPLS